jgi:hypothetical protein
MSKKLTGNAIKCHDGIIIHEYVNDKGEFSYNVKKQPNLFYKEIYAFLVYIFSSKALKKIA